MKAVLMALVALAAVGCASTSRSPYLWDSRAAFADNAEVSLIGRLGAGSERRHLYEVGRTHPTDADCISLDLGRVDRAAVFAQDGQLVRVEGTYRKDIAGGDVFLGLCSLDGIIVTRVEPVRIR